MASAVLLLHGGATEALLPVGRPTVVRFASRTVAGPQADPRQDDGADPRAGKGPATADPDAILAAAAIKASLLSRPTDRT